MYSLNTKLRSGAQYADKRLLANIIYMPSYITSDFALYEYNLIPEAVFNVTSVTTGRNRKFTTSLGTFVYHYYPHRIYQSGIMRKTTESGGYGHLIACPEKALCDKIYLDKSSGAATLSGMLDYLENNLRIDIDSLMNLDLALISYFDKLFNHRRISLLHNLIEKLKKD